MLGGPLLLLALAIADPGSSPFSGLGDQPASLDADRLYAERKLEIYVAEGHVVLRRAGLTLFADRITYQRKLATVVAEGHVIAVEGSSVLSCERVVLELPELLGTLEAAEVRIKEQASTGTTAGDALLGGRDRMRLSADELTRTGARSFELRGGAFTPCRCAPGTTPDWKLTASYADVDVDSGAWLLAPVFRIKDVPVLILPAFYVPLGERRSGLLIPTGGYSAPTGFKLGLPLYLTFGPSYDATLSSDFWFARGPAPGLELRAAPSPGFTAEAEARVVIDGGAPPKPGGTIKLVGGTWQPRFALGGKLRRISDDELDLGGELNFVGDPGYVSEFGAEFLSRQAEESVSRFLIRWPTAPELRVALGLGIREDIRSKTYAGLVPVGADARIALREISLFSSDPKGPGSVRYRLADLRLDALPYRFSPIGLLGEARLIASAFLATSDAVGRFGRVDFRPQIALPIRGDRFFTLTPEIALRLTAWGGSGSGTAQATAGRVAPIFRTRLESELYARGETVTHLIRPRLEHLLIPAIAGQVPPGYDTADEIDRLAAVHQVAASLENVLWLKGYPTPLLDLVVTLGDDLSLSSPGAGISELVTKATLSAPLDPPWILALEGDLVLGLDDRNARGIFLTGHAARTDVFDATLSWVDGGGPIPRASFVGPEELVPNALVPVDRYRAGVLSTDKTALPWAPYRAVAGTLAFDLFAPLRAVFGIAVDVIAPPPAVSSPVRYVSGTLAYRSPCDCWSASLTLVQARDRATPDVHFMLDLAQLGGSGF